MGAESRSDKKEQTKPYVSIVVLEVVNDIRKYIGSSSNGETARQIVLKAYEEWSIIERLSPFLRWDFVRGDHTYVGHRDHMEITSVLPDQWSRTERLPIRFTPLDIQRLELLKFSLACPFAHMVGALLRFGIESDRVIQGVAPGYVYKSAYSLRNGVWPR